MRESLISWLMNGVNDFWDDEYMDYKKYNEQEIDITDRLISLLENYADSGFYYDITSQCAFESCGLDVYTISIAAVTIEEGKKPEVESIIFIAKSY